MRPAAFLKTRLPGPKPVRNNDRSLSIGFPEGMQKSRPRHNDEEAEDLRRYGRRRNLYQTDRLTDRQKVTLTRDTFVNDDEAGGDNNKR